MSRPRPVPTSPEKGCRNAVNPSVGCQDGQGSGQPKTSPGAARVEPRGRAARQQSICKAKLRLNMVFRAASGQCLYGIACTQPHGQYQGCCWMQLAQHHRCVSEVKTLFLLIQKTPSCGLAGWGMKSFLQEGSLNSLKCKPTH